MGYLLDSRGSFPSRGKGYFYTPHRPDQPWGSPTFLFGGYRALFPRGQSGLGEKLTTYLHVVLSSRMVDLYIHSTYVLVE
jgi:hypothetical protein